MSLQGFVLVRGGFCLGVLSGVFVWKVLSGWFCSSPFCQHTSVTYNIKLNITFNFRFCAYIGPYEGNFKSVLLDPIPLSKTVTPSRTPSHLEDDVLYGRLHAGSYNLAI